MAETICLRMLICLMVVLMASSAIGGREKRQVHVPTTLLRLLRSTSFSFNCVTLQTLPIDPQGCSLGQLRCPLDESDRLNESGTYLLPDDISCNGVLVSVYTCFFYNDGGDTSNTNFRLHVGVFRLMGDNYTQVGQFSINLRRQSSSETQGCAEMNPTNPQPVLEGDKLAVSVTRNCANGICPLQPILRAASSVSVFFTTSPNVTAIPVSQIQASDRYTNVYLDVSASMIPTTSQSRPQSTSTSFSSMTQSPLTSALPTTLLPLLQSTSTSLSYVTPSLLQTLPIVPTTLLPLLQSTSTSLSYVTPSLLQTLPIATGDQQPVLGLGATAGIAIAAVTFVVVLIIVSLGICWLHIRKVHSKRPNSDGQTTLFINVDMQSAYRQIPLSSAEPFDTKNPERAPAPPTDTTTSSPVSELLQLLPQNLVIHGSCIKLLKSIGEGRLKDSETKVLPEGSILNILCPHIKSPRKHMTILIALKPGTFGIVYKAHYRRHEGSAVETVAVKSLKAIFTSGDLQNLVKEIQLMQFFDHPNVMSLLGVYLNSECLEAKSAPCLVMPYMANGSLLTYLRKAKKALVLPKDATAEQVEQVQREVFKMCYEIALGMSYLAKNKFVHRDLSARNCMMGSDGTIKVADFGLSEDIYTKSYFRVDTSVPIAVPFKWMPLESLEEGIYNEKTDVWSFGITSWEVFTGGKLPYTAMSVRDILQLLKSGGRLDKPENAACSEDIYTMMLNCWDDDPDKRPHFLQVATTLSNMLQTVSGYLNLNQFQAKESLPPLLPPADPIDPPIPMNEVPPSPTQPQQSL